MSNYKKGFTFNNTRKTQASWYCDEKQRRVYGEYRYIGHHYTPDIEVFIEHWQKAKSQVEVRESLILALEKVRTVEDKGLPFLIAECAALKSRADKWRKKGVPLQCLPLEILPEAEEDKIVRLSALATSFTK